MLRIRWYGPTLLLLATVVGAMLLGPSMIRRITRNAQAYQIEQVRQSLIEDPTLDALSSSFEKVATVVSPGTTSIAVYHRDGQGREDLRKQSNGSGWVYRYYPEDEEGYRDYIITNHHVIELYLTGQANQIEVHFADHGVYRATVIGSDPRTDVAVLEIDRAQMDALPLDMRPARQGEIVFAFGSPFEFKFSMSQGVVSATGRQLGSAQRVARGYQDFIQTDAAINPGNSGGPLTNVHGEVIGMNTAIIKRDQDDDSFNGLGFAIPIAMVVEVADQLIAHGEVQRGFLGVLISDIDNATARELGFTGRGVLCTPLPDGPAAMAGLELGDIITRVAGTAVSNSEKLRIAVSSHRPGTEIDLEVWRFGIETTLTVRLAEDPDSVSGIGRAPSGLPDPFVSQRGTPMAALGLGRIEDFTPGLAQQMGRAYTPGVLIRMVDTDKPADRAGIARMMVVTQIDSRSINEVSDLTRWINSLSVGDSVLLTLKDWRPGVERYHEMTVELSIE